MKDLEEVVDKVKSVEDGVTTIIVPLLKHSIEDGNHHNKRLFVINMMLVLALLVISVASMVIISLQNQKYIEFISQFDFESDTIYQQTDDYSNINSGININR